MTMREDLRACPGLYNLPPPHLKSLTNMAGERFVTQGELFFQEGDILTALFLLVTGSAAISRLWLGQHETFIRSVFPGELFGWSVLRPPYQAAASVRAITPCRALLFSREWLSPLLQASPELRLRIGQGETAVPEHIRYFQVEDLAQMVA